MEYPGEMTLVDKARLGSDRGNGQMRSHQQLACAFDTQMTLVFPH